MIRAALRAIVGLFTAVAFLLIVSALVWGLVATGTFDIEGGQVDPTGGPSPPSDLDRNASAPADTRSDGPDAIEGSEREADIERAIHRDVNAIRTDRDLAELDHDDEIANVARAHSVDMHERDYFSHVGPNGSTPADRMERADLFPDPCEGVGENLGMIWTSADQLDATRSEDIAERIVQGWMDSEGHRENLLADRWHRQGIGVHVSDDGEVYATQLFCADRDR